MENVTENQLVPFDGGGDIYQVPRPPEAVLAEAQACAKALKRVVSATKAVSVFGGREHLHFTAWQTLATFFRLSPRIRETRLIDVNGVVGYEAFAEVVHIPTGQVVSSGEGMCLNDEANWGTRPKYEWRDGKKVKVGDERVPLFQLRSMAQTRAAAKALRNVLSWVVVMAGYEPTAAEEMDGTADMSGPIPQPQPKESTGTISEKQAKRLWALAHQAGKPKDEVVAIIKSHGFSSTAEITTDVYEKICEEVSAS